MSACELFGTGETMSAGTCLALFLSEGGPLTLFPDGKEVLQAGEMLLLESGEEVAACRISAEAEGELIAARIRVMPENRWDGAEGINRQNQKQSK
ncbi:MAG: hypothetical protein LUF00_08795 [Lachnospiraceae bacterium]|nr:hypothetical protein [Lachnospiraceae bacterium]